MPDTQTKSDLASDPSFEDSAREVSIRIRDSLVEALTTAGVDATRPQSMVTQLGINKILAWRLARVVTDDDPAATITRLPGNAAMRILSGALAKAGTPARALEAVQAATDSLENLIQTHAGDRETLCMMLSGLSPEGQREREEAIRKLSFSGNSGTWGIAAKVQISAHFVAPGSDPSTLDLARLGGFIELRRLRSQVPWPIATVYTASDSGRHSDRPRWEPIDPSMTAPEFPPLMPQFCSKPLPQVLVRTTAEGVTRYELAPGPVGNTAAMTCISGRLTRGAVARYRTPDDALGEHLLHLTTPVEVIFHDLFVHHTLAKELVPRFFLYSQLGAAAPYPLDGRERGLLPVCDEVIDLGAGPPALATPEIPRYREMAETAVRAMGHSLPDFRGYRVRMRYPPIPTIAVLRHALAEAPNRHGP